MGRLFNNRFNMFAPKTGLVENMVNVLIDVYLPCEYPDWLPDGEVQELQNYSFDMVPFPHQHLGLLKTKMAPGGSLRLSPFDERMFPMLENEGFTIVGFEEDTQTVEGRLL